METEKPNSAAAVKNTLIAVTRPVPNYRISLSHIRLDRIVPPAIIIEIIPAKDMDVSNSLYITGQPEPSKESGNPRLINARYIIASNNEIIFHFPFKFIISDHILAHQTSK